MFKSRETAVKIARIVLTGAAALTIISSAGLAQQALTGTITKINRITGTVAIQRAENGTVGTSPGGVAEEFKVQDGVSLDVVHAGDRVTFSATEAGGTKTITKLEKQKR